MAANTTGVTPSEQLGSGRVGGRRTSNSPRARVGRETDESAVGTCLVTVVSGFRGPYLLSPRTTAGIQGSARTRTHDSCGSPSHVAAIQRLPQHSTRWATPGQGGEHRHVYLRVAASPGERGKGREAAGKTGTARAAGGGGARRSRSRSRSGSGERSREAARQGNASERPPVLYQPAAWPTAVDHSRAHYEQRAVIGPRM
jgi:hypothetical protein